MARGFPIHDPSLAELIRVKNYKQALKNIDKKLKKQSTDFGLSALKADLLLKNGELAESHKHCLALLSRSDVPIDLDSVIQINDLATALSIRGHVVPISQLDAVWQHTVKAHGPMSAKLEAAEDWAEQAIKNQQWSSLSKAAATLSRLLPESDARHRKYYFWQIIGHWLSKPDATVTDERMRSLGRMMATRMLDKAIEQTPATPKQSSQDKAPQQSISSRGDFELLRTIFLQLDKGAQVMDAINTKSLDLHSPPAVDGWGTRLTKIDLLLQQGKSQDAWDLCKGILDDAKTSDLQWKTDDWAYWQRLLEASQDASSLAATQQLVTATTDSLPRARAPAIANLEARSLAASSSTDTNSNHGLLEAAKEFFERFSDQPRCASELQSSLQTVSASDRLEFRKHLQSLLEEKVKTDMNATEQLRWITREVNMLELDYLWYLDFSDSSSDQPNTVEALKAFISNALRLYQTSKQHTASLPDTDTYPGDEACILAVRALVKLSRATQKKGYVVLTLFLLSRLLQDSQYNSTARIMIVNVAMALGLPAVAFKNYQHMRVRQILIESCAPLMLYRAATYLPLRVDAADLYKPASDHLRFYADSLDQIPRYQMTALNSENYAQTEEFNDFKHQLQNSATRRMLRLERARMARFRVMTCNEDGLGFEQHPPRGEHGVQASDTSAEVSQSSWNDSIKDQIILDEPPLLSEEALQAQEATQHVFGLIFSASPPCEADIARLHSYLETPARQAAGLTPAERDATTHAKSAAALLVALFKQGGDGSHKKANEDSIIAALEHVHACLLESSPTIPTATSDAQPWAVPDWAFYHATYTHLEVLAAYNKLAAKALNHCKTVLKLPAAALKDAARLLGAIQALAQQQHRALLDTAARQRDAAGRMLADDGAAARLLAEAGEEVGAAVEGVVGLPEMKRHLRGFGEAAREALQCFERIGLP